MFTGIIECVGTVADISIAGGNKTFWIQSGISAALQPDQSVSHDGVCLTIEEIIDNTHRVTAIAETLKKSRLGRMTNGDLVNLERSLSLSSRLDGHFVQGHVDTTGRCIGKKEKNGSREYEFGFPKKFAPYVVEKGSICVNGVSLTAFQVSKKSFRTAIIPYTYEHTNMKAVNEGDGVNIEFDLLGKYMLRKLSLKE